MASRDEDAPPEKVDLSPQERSAIVHDAMDRHYRDTLDQPVPALGNKTPRAAVKTASGRAKVVAWLKSMENQTAQAGVSDSAMATRSEIHRGGSTPFRFRRRARARLDRYPVDVAPFPQSRFGRLGLEVVPSVERPFSLQQILEPRIGAFLVEYPPDIIEVFGQTFPGERQHQRLAEIELLPVRDRKIFLLVIGIVRPRLDVFVDVRIPEKLAGFPTEHGLMFVRLPEAGEFERVEQLVPVNRYRHRCSPVCCRWCCNPDRHCVRNNG
jgi:hypothetical protein